MRIYAGGIPASPAAQPSEYSFTTQESSAAADKPGVELAGIAARGLSQAQKKFEKAAERIARSGEDACEPAGPAQDAVDLLSARNQFEASLKVLETAAETQKRLLDIFA